VKLLRRFVPILLLAATPQAHAQVVKCRSDSGHVTYTEERCPAGSAQEDLPVNLPPAVAGESAPRASDPELEKYLAECLESAGSLHCNAYEQMRVRCQRPAQPDRDQCRVFHEASARLRAQKAATRLEALKTQCATGKVSVCEELVCPASFDAEPDYQKVVACSQHRHLPTNARWSQVRELSDDLGNWSGEFVCAESFVIDRRGSRSVARGGLTVQAVAASRGGRGFVVADLKGLRNQIFDSDAAAADAGCKFSGNWYRELSSPPR
jgi:hypothetical protein